MPQIFGFTFEPLEVPLPLVSYIGDSVHKLDVVYNVRPWLLTDEQRQWYISARAQKAYLFLAYPGRFPEGHNDHWYGTQFEVLYLTELGFRDQYLAYLVSGLVPLGF
jgi:hypothetical protein